MPGRGGRKGPGRGKVANRRGRLGPARVGLRERKPRPHVRGRPASPHVGRGTPSACNTTRCPLQIPPGGQPRRGVHAGKRSGSGPLRAIPRRPLFAPLARPEIANSRALGPVAAKRGRGHPHELPQESFEVAAQGGRSCRSAEVNSWRVAPPTSADELGQGPRSPAWLMRCSKYRVVFGRAMKPRAELKSSRRIRNSFLCPTTSVVATWLRPSGQTDKIPTERIARRSRSLQVSNVLTRYSECLL